jgi:oligopeptide transport system substrate-binding protein
VKKAIIFILAVLVIATVAVSGCSLFNNSSAPRSASSSGGVLNLWESEDPTTLDPALQNELGSAQYILEIFSGLVKLDEKLQPAPDIARSWDITADGLTYTFHLRQDVTFQDGKALTARDVVYSWERTTDPATGSLNAATYLGDIVGVADKLSGKAGQISGVQATDDYTLQVKLNVPRSYFLYKLAYPTAMVMDQKNVSSGSDWWHKPNGSGPFKLAGWSKGQSLTLEKNTHYYGTQPLVDRVEFQFFTGLPMDLYETGKIDVANVYTDYLDRATDKAGPFYADLKVSPALGIYYVGFNCGQQPFDNVNLRKAFAMSVDKDKLISLVYRGMEEKANGILPPGMPGYNPGVAGTGYDVNQARELLKSSGIDLSQPGQVTFTTYGYAGSAGGVLQALIYQWKQNLGIDVQVRQLEPERYFYNTKAEIDQLFDSGWSADYPHPQDFLDILFSSGSNNNYGNYASPQFDTLIQQANSTADQALSFGLYQQAEQIAVSDVACIPISFSKNYILVKPYVRGFSIDPLGFPTLDTVSILPH